jgi:hypothetical protein
MPVRDLRTYSLSQDFPISRAQLMASRTEWNSRIAQSPPTIQYNGIMTESGEGEKGVLALLDRVVCR